MPIRPALVLPGGVANPDQLRIDNDAVRFVRGFFEQDKQPVDTGAARSGEAGRRAGGKPVGVICHGPWMLAEADVVRGRRELLVEQPARVAAVRDSVE